MKKTVKAVAVLLLVLIFGLAALDIYLIKNRKCGRKVRPMELMK